MTRLVAALLVLSLSVGAAVAQGGDDGLAGMGIGLSDAGGLSVRGSVVAQLDLAALAPTPTHEAGDAATASARSVGYSQLRATNSQADFLRGYDAHGGNSAWRTRFIDTFWGPTAACPFGESTGNPLAVSEAGHLGLGSFHPDTWRRVWELAGMPVQDWRSPFWQGAATAIWSNEVGPEPPAGWSCFG